MSFYSSTHKLNNAIELIMDPISDFFTRIRNGYHARLATVVLPYSKLKEEIARILEAKRYIAGVEKKGRKVRKFLEVKLRFDGTNPAIHGVRILSKPSRRLYVKADGIKAVRQGFGVLIVSTSKGLMTGDDAKKASLGGEMIVEVW